MTKRIIVPLILLIIFSNLHLQGSDENIDSLWNLYLHAKHDTTQIKVLLDLGDIFKNQKPDSALHFYNKALDLTNLALTTSENNQSAFRDYQIIAQSLKAKLLKKIGSVNRLQGNYNDAIENYFLSLQIYEEISDTKEMANQYNNIGYCHFRQGHYNLALEFYLNAFEIFEKSGNRGEIVKYYNNIGLIHDYQGSFEKAMKYFFDALRISEELDDKKGISRCNNNIGHIYMNQGNYDQALEYFFKSLEIKEEFGDKRGMSICYKNIGFSFKSQGKLDKALEYYLQSSSIDEKLGDKHGIAGNYRNIANLYIAFADTCNSPELDKWKKHLNTAIDYGEKAYNIALEIGALRRQNVAAQYLQLAYTKLGKYQEALKYAEIFIATRDSMFSEEKTKAIAEMTTKYEAERNQLQIEKLEQQKELDDKTIEAQRAENRKQQILIFSVVGGFIIVLVFSITILRMFRQKENANVLLAAQNDEINKQKEQIEEQNLNITDSIVYAQRIQRALLPPGDYMKQLIPHRFVLYKPRDIVSGDFYWVSKKNGLVVTAAADCTGHGVPGAMMSMLGVSILNEIVNTMQNPDAGEILNNFRSKLIESLHQGGTESHMWDGIDTAICLIDIEKQEVQYAGANCPLYIVREGVLKEIKGDKMPIGIHARMDGFTNHKIKIQSADMLYIFSDGYSDQFGGEFDKRFTQRRFKELLVGIHTKSMTDQQEELERTLNEWQGKSDQIDDILVMGVRI